MPVKKIPTARATPAKAPRRNPRPVKTTAAPKPAPAASLKAKTGPAPAPKPAPVPTPAPQPPAAGGKMGLLISLLSTPKGATIHELAEALGWQVHSVRGALAGALKKSRGLTILSEKADGEYRTYRIAPPEPAPPAKPNGRTRAR